MRVNLRILSLLSVMWAFVLGGISMSSCVLHDHHHPSVHHAKHKKHKKHKPGKRKGQRRGHPGKGKAKGHHK